MFSSCRLLTASVKIKHQTDHQIRHCRTLRNVTKCYGTQQPQANM
ncbi:hypothetical protein BIFGAL_03873 [Bifidobacterium gallicum DSM 20093 = LMG 11596]|uniref:Uncharacterized protein n=1 Tax=Bifidobacterium gallicum DSM 20093 = LMG 11596 TaxID=561180 RepID=D1NVI4_9BIFI|nr:hypothetical protein BIFGAL_03873 [Bifidobacterium gallicum DSM 20093 = LMG 11596]